MKYLVIYEDLPFEDDKYVLVGIGPKGREVSRERFHTRQGAEDEKEKREKEHHNNGV